MVVASGGDAGGPASQRVSKTAEHYDACRRVRQRSGAISSVSDRSEEDGQVETRIGARRQVWLLGRGLREFIGKHQRRTRPVGKDQCRTGQAGQQVAGFRTLIAVDDYGAPVKSKPGLPRGALGVR